MSGHISNAIAKAKTAAHGLLVCTVEKIVWEGDEGGPVILRGTMGESVKSDSGSGEIEEGCRYKFYGTYQESAKWGRQFISTAWTEDIGSGRAGVVKYLAKTCPGIGDVRAGQLYDKGGPNCVKHLRDYPESIIEAGVLSEEVAMNASSALRADEKLQQVKIDLFDLFAGRGLGAAAIKECCRLFGERAAATIGRNPWQLILKRIPGAGWKRVDQLYLDRGGDPAALKRQAMAGWFALREKANGNTWSPLSCFHGGIVEQVGASKTNFEGALTLAVRSKLVEIEKEFDPGAFLADPAAASAERRLALAIAKLTHRIPASWPEIVPEALTQHQLAAYTQAATSPLLILSGTPGTGKTWLAAAVIRAATLRGGGCKIAVCAPTGKAAVRIQENLLRNQLNIEATTIHSLLGIASAGYDGNGWDFQHDENNPLECDLLVVDEFSMADAPLAASLLSAVRPGAHVLIVGDPYQLPPVGHGAPLRDMLRAGLPNAELTEIKRNAGTITTACVEVKNGKCPTTVARLNADAGDNLKIIEARTEDEQVAMMANLLIALRAKPNTDPVWDCMVITPMNERGRVSRKPLNDYLQNLLNPVQAGDVQAKQDSFRLRDKIICLKNGIHDMQRFNPHAKIHLSESWSTVQATLMQPGRVYVANGELGRVVAVSQRNGDVVLRFDSPQRYIKIRVNNRVQHKDGDSSAREDGFALGFAMTGHKTQGSEADYVIAMIDPNADRVASREWIYTVISRGKKWTVLIGSKQVLARQVKRAELPLRKTFLKELINKELEEVP